MAVLDGHYLRSHRVGLAYQPIRGCFLRFESVHSVFLFVWVHQGVQGSLGVEALLFQDVVGLKHRPYGEERVCRQVRVVESGVRGCWFWLVCPRVSGSQDGSEPQHGKRFAASGPVRQLVCLVRLPDAVSVGMALAAALMWKEQLVRPPGCWAAGLAPWASRSWVSLPQASQQPRVLLE